MYGDTWLVDKAKRDADTHKPYDRPEDTWLVEGAERDTNAQKWNALVGRWGGRQDGGGGHLYTPNLYAKAHEFGGSIFLG